jgi:hypothetical protein
MNASLAEYLAQIRDAYQQNATNPEIPNPLQAGMQMGHQMMGLSPEQTQQAQGMGFINLGQAYGQPARSQFERINNALGAGIQGYLGERGRQAQINATLHEQAIKQRQNELKYAHLLAQQEEKSRQHAETLEQRKREHEEKLEENKRFHDLMHQDRIESRHLREDKNKEELGQPLDASEVPLSKYGREFVKKWETRVADEVGKIPVNKQTLNTIEEMRDIFNKYPKIGESFLNILVSSEPNTFELIGRQLEGLFRSGDEIAAIQQLEKLSADLNLSTITGLTGVRPTDIMKKEIKRAAPSGRLKASAFNKIADSWEKKAHTNIERAERFEDALSRGMYVKSGSKQKESPQEMAIPSILPQPQMQEMAPPQDFSQMSTEELKRLREQIAKNAS